MRILHVVIGVGPSTGGGGERTYRLTTELLELGHDVRMVMTDRWMRDGQLPATHPFPIDRVLALHSYIDRFNVCALPLRRLTAEIDAADIVHLHGLYWPAPMVIGRLAQRRGKPVVVTTLGTLPPRGRSMVLKRLALRGVAGGILQRAAAIVAVTPEEKVGLRPFAGPHTITTVIPNGVVATPTTKTPEEFRQQFGIGGDYVFFIARLVPSKGADLLIEAFARTRTEHDHHLVIAGSGHAEAELRAAAARSGASDRIHFAGPISAEWRTAAIRGASFVAIPSRVDAMTIVVLEAAIESAPVLLTRTCNFPDVADCGGGRSVEPNADAITEGLRWMFAHRAEWPAMGERISTLARRYTWRAAAAQHADLYEKVVAR